MKISVCMATYNGSHYIKEQLDSILSQLGDSDEVIISDDNSKDNTKKIIEEIGDHRIKVFNNTNESGYAKNFENALTKATGEFIFLADQDDVWIEGKVSRTINILDNYDFVVSDATIVDENLKTIHPSHFKIHNVRKGFLINMALPRYIGACMAFNRDVLNYALPFPNKQKLSAHDYWISLCAELNFSTYLIEEPLILYRRHSDNASNGGTKSQNSLYHKLSVRIYTLLQLFQRLFNHEH